MKSHLLIAVVLSLCLNADAQYRKEAQQSQDTLVGKRVWISPPVPMEGGDIVYRETVPAGNSLKDDLFANALEWYNYNYKTADTRLEMENQEAGKISGTGVIKYTPVAAGIAGEMPIFFSFDLDIQDGRYAYRVYNIYGIDGNGKFQYADMYREDRSNSTLLKKRWDKSYRYEMLSDMNTMIEMMIAHLKQAMVRDERTTIR